MKMYFPIILVLLLTVSFLMEGCRRQEKKLPNIILITVDDLGWTDLGCYGSRYYETPHIDKMAGEGILFTNAYAAAAICSPTRAAIQTGKHPARTGITDWIRARFQGGGEENPSGYDENPGRLLRTPKNPFHLELEEKTVAEWLKEAGYVTAHIGKWHLGTERWFPGEQGYDVNVAGCDYGQPPDYFDPYYSYPRREGQDTLKGFPTMEARQEGEYLTDREAYEAVSFIRENRDGPFFLNLCHYAVHTPLQAKENLIEKYESKEPTNQNSPVYAAMVQSVDEALGKIREALTGLNLDKETLIIFTSDNGGLLMPRATHNAPLRLGKGYPYEGGIRIPAIFCWPEYLPAGSVIDQPVISMDLLPTICEAAGISLAPGDTIDGLSLMNLMEKGKGLDRESLYWHFPHYRGEDVGPYSVIRRGDWKLIKRYEGEPSELYHLGEDLSETRDRAGENPDLVRSLEEELEDRLESVDAEMPVMKENVEEPQVSDGVQ